MMDDLISVIIPIYKVEQFLPRCLDSVLAQTYQNLEIILIDDGSTDNCGKICDDYAEKDKRITVIHKENGGLSSARNAGLDIATGEYITFIDSDDFINHKMIERLADTMTECCADVVICNHKKVFEKDCVDESEDIAASKPNIYGYYDVISLYDLKSVVPAISACGKLYKKKCFSNIRYPLNRLFEDLATTYKIMFASEKIAYIDEQLYYYLQRNGSIMNGKTPPTVDGVKGLNEFADYCNSNIADENYLKECRKIITKRQCDIILNGYFLCYKRHLDKDEKQLHQEMYADYSAYLKTNNIRLPKAQLYDFSPELFLAVMYVYYWLFRDRF